MTKLCECGCGKSAPISSRNDASCGRVKGLPLRFIKGHTIKMNIPIRTGDRNPRWRGGRFVRMGYVFILQPAHPRADHHGYVLEHLVIAERALGRTLPIEVEVHHVNEVRTENAGWNLVICEDGAYHKLLHRRTRAYRATGNVHARKCPFCKTFDVIENMVQATKKTFFHRLCRNAENRRRRALIHQSS